MIQKETHPWKWYVPAKSRILIIGTFPPVKEKWSYQFFYPNKQNLFWPVMSTLINKPLEHLSGEAAVDERKYILQLLSAGITDMGLEIERNGNSSLDENLTAIQYMDVFKILKENISINKIIFTSSSGKASALGWFVNYLRMNNVNFKFPTGTKPLRSEFQFEGRLIQLVILYSPSRRAANRISFEKLVEMYSKEMILLNNNLKSAEG
jgi:G:T/U-mismatch repair DNA glycosylase